MTRDELAALLRAVINEQPVPEPWMLTSQYQEWKRWRKQRGLPGTLRISRPRIRTPFQRTTTEARLVRQREWTRARYASVAAGLTPAQQAARAEYRRLLALRGAKPRGRPRADPFWRGTGPDTQGGSRGS